MENDNLNLLNELLGLIPDDENQQLRFLSTMRSDANFNELHEEEYSAQFPGSTLPFHPYTDADWSFDGSQLDLSPQGWLNSNLKSTQEKTISALDIRNPEPPNSCSDLTGCERDVNNNTLQSSGCVEQIDLNITVDAETPDVGCKTKATTLAETSAETKCRNKDDMYPVQGNEDVRNSLQIAATFMTASGNSQIGSSSESRFSDLESCLHKLDQIQGRCEQRSHTNVENFSSESSRFAPPLGISTAIPVPNQAFELEQSVVPSQPPQNICNAPTSGNQYTCEFGTVKDYGLVESYPNPTCTSSSPPQLSSSTTLADTDISLGAQLAQILSHDPIKPKKTKIDPNLQKKDKISQPTLSVNVPDLVSSKIEDLRDRSVLRSKTASYHIKCQDLEQTQELSGHKCYLCKRDLSVKPEGSYAVPKNPPTVAVLPCSHAFHGLCLERITPQNQAQDPPCIPCAIGDV